MSSSAVEDWDRIVNKNVRSKDMEGIGSVVAVQEDSVIIATEGAQHEYKIPKSNVEGYNGAEVFLDLSSNEMSAYDIANKSKTLVEESSKTIPSSPSPLSSSPTQTPSTITSPIPTQVARRPEILSSIENHAPVIEAGKEKKEKSDLSNIGLVSSKQKTTMTKKPLSETKTVDVQQIKEDSTVEMKKTRPITSTTPITTTTTSTPAAIATTTRSTEEQLQSKAKVNNIMPPPKKEKQPNVSKQSSVYEEAITRKEPITDIQEQDLKEQYPLSNIDNNKEGTRDQRGDIYPFTSGIDFWQHSISAWIDIYNEFAKNAGRIAGYWFNLFWSPWTGEQKHSEKVNIE